MCNVFVTLSLNENNSRFSFRFQKMTSGKFKEANISVVYSRLNKFSTWNTNMLLVVLCGFSPSHIEGTSKPVDRPGYCHYQVIAIKKVGVRFSPFFSMFLPMVSIYLIVSIPMGLTHTLCLHVQHRYCHMAIISTSAMFIPAA